MATIAMYSRATTYGSLLQMNQVHEKGGWAAESEDDDEDGDTSAITEDDDVEDPSVTFEYEQTLDALIAGSQQMDANRKCHSHSHPTPGLSPFLTNLILINYMSAGFILLPGGFAAGGVLLSAIVFVVVKLQAFVTSVFILETCARAELLESAHHVSGGPLNCSIRIRHRTFELSLLNHIFLGSALSTFFAAIMSADLYSLLWAYAAVFGTTLSSLIPIPGTEEYAYEAYIAIFILIAIPLSCTSILDQIYVQFAFLCGRLIMVMLMITTLIAAYAHPDQAHFGNQVGPAKNVPLADWSQVTHAISTAVFATAFQYSVPAVASVSRDKRVLRQIFMSAVGFIFIANLILALMTSIYFGLGTNASNNMNWLDYHGGTGSADGRRSPWSAAISYYVVLMAAVDGIAIFPLSAVSLGEILMGAIFGNRVHEFENNWKVRGAFRLLASVPQAVGALFVRDLGVIAAYGSIFALLSYTTCPSMLWLMSERRMKKDGLTSKTAYSCRFFTSSIWAYLLIALSLLAVVGVTLSDVLVTT